MKTIHLPRANVTVAFQDRGSGTPIVLLHAFPLDSGMWAEQIDVLATNHRLLAPDLPGFGGTTLMPNWTIDAAADLVAEFLSAAGVTEPVALAGLSMGGYIALAFARGHPHLLSTLILADTKAEPDDDKAKDGRATMIALAKEKGSAAVIAAMLPKMLGNATQVRQPAIGETVLAMGSRQSVDGIVAGIAALRDRPDARPGLKAIAVPTLVLVGEDDAITPVANARTLADGIPGARLEVIASAGHLANLEAPEAFNQLIINAVSR